MKKKCKMKMIYIKWERERAQFLCRTLLMTVVQRTVLWDYYSEVKGCKGPGRVGVRGTTGMVLLSYTVNRNCWMGFESLAFISNIPSLHKLCLSRHFMAC